VGFGVANEFATCDPTASRYLCVRGVHLGADCLGRMARGLMRLRAGESCGERRCRDEHRDNGC